MHQNVLWLAADLWMDTHWEDEGVVLPVGEIELFQPQSLDDMWVDEALGSWSAWYGLERRPVVEVPGP